MVRFKLIALLCLALPVIVIQGQQHVTIKHDAMKQSEDSGFDNCETNSATLDRISNIAQQAKDPDDKVIAIARLGKGEMISELAHRRLYTVRTYLQARGVAPDKLITAEGDNVSGFGRVDFYIGGKLSDSLITEKCKDLPVGNCIEDFYAEPYYLQRKSKMRWCK